MGPAHASIPRRSLLGKVKARERDHSLALPLESHRKAAVEPVLREPDGCSSPAGPLVRVIDAVLAGLVPVYKVAHPSPWDSSVESESNRVPSQDAAQVGSASSASSTNSMSGRSTAESSPSRGSAARPQPRVLCWKPKRNSSTRPRLPSRSAPHFSTIRVLEHRAPRDYRLINAVADQASVRRRY